MIWTRSKGSMTYWQDISVKSAIHQKPFQTKSPLLFQKTYFNPISLFHFQTNFQIQLTPNYFSISDTNNLTSIIDVEEDGNLI